MPSSFMYSQIECQLYPPKTCNQSFTTDLAVITETLVTKVIVIESTISIWLEGSALLGTHSGTLFCLVTRYRSLFVSSIPVCHFSNFDLFKNLNQDRYKRVIVRSHYLTLQVHSKNCHYNPKKRNLAHHRFQQPNFPWFHSRIHELLSKAILIFGSFEKLLAFFKDLYIALWLHSVHKYLISHHSSDQKILVVI